jgi:hypothetical protein
MNDKPFWDVEENIGFKKIKSDIDSLEYKIYDKKDNGESLVECANALAKVRRDINYILFYLCRHPEEWIHKNIALGIFMTLDLHIPCICDNIDIILNSKNDSELSNIINKECLKIGKLFSIQEMTPNNYGILGLNKPKELGLVEFNLMNEKIKYEVAIKRSFHLTIRDSNNKLKDYSKIISLAVHELTHTTCNDNVWKEDNHKYPFDEYHSFLKIIYSKIKNK